MKTAFIICGALGREVQDIIIKYGWDAKAFGVSATHHLHPQKITPDVESRILELRPHYERLIVVYGDCGTNGTLDKLLTEYDIERVAGMNCYEMFCGGKFQEYITQEPGTFFLTDFLVKSFKGSVIKGLGLDRYPELKTDYFYQYKRVVYLSQNGDQKLLDSAREIAEYLELPLTVQPTGYGDLETELVRLMAGDK